MNHRKMQCLKLLLALGALLIFCSAIWAAVPKLINFQGILKDGSGNPVADGSYSVTFIIYDAPTGGQKLWMETQSVATTKGLFTVLLGASNPVPDSVFLDSSRYLGIAVTPDPEMTPRQQLLSVGYAYRVSSVDGARGGNITTKVSIGSNHTNTGNVAFVAGFENTASGNSSTIPGGQDDTTSGTFTVVSGGLQNVASGNYASIGGGDLNRASGQQARVGGGYNNTASVVNATVGGGGSNAAAGSAATVSGGLADTANGSSATIGGGRLNTASNDSSTVSGGAHNTASGIGSTVSGGFNNNASGDGSAIGGGSVDSASGTSATVGGGQVNVASGDLATVPGGWKNNAAGFVSFAAGRRAKANEDGSFVWADNHNFDFNSNGANTFSARCVGGARFVSAIDGSGNPTAGVSLASGGGSWSSISDRNLKANFQPVNLSELLAKVANLPITIWNYKAQKASIRHIGPMAQDFHAAFGVGEDDKHITTIDADGVALAAIQGLYQIVQQQQQQIEFLEKRIKEIYGRKPQAKTE